MKKLFSVLAALFILGTVNVFALGIGAQGGYSVGESGNGNGAITFKVDTLPCVFAIDAQFGDITTIGASADWWTKNPKIEGTWGYYYGLGVAGSVALADNNSAVSIGGRFLAGTNVFFFDKFLELYLQAAWQPMFTISNGAKFYNSFPINIGFRFWL